MDRSPNLAQAEYPAPLVPVSFSAMGLNSSGLMYISWSVSREEKRKRPSVPRTFNADSCWEEGAGLKALAGPKLPVPVPSRQLLPDAAAPSILPESPLHTCHPICSNVTSQQPQSFPVPLSVAAGPQLHSTPSSIVYSESPLSPPTT